MTVQAALVEFYDLGDFELQLPAELVEILAWKFTTAPTTMTGMGGDHSCHVRG